MEKAIGRLFNKHNHNELTPMSLEKGFFVKNMKDKTLHNVIVKWNEFIELLKIE
jgi:hypothetical protein